MACRSALVLKSQKGEGWCGTLNWKSSWNCCCTSWVCARPRQWRGSQCVCATTSSSASSGSKATPVSAMNALLTASTMPRVAAHLHTRNPCIPSGPTWIKQSTTTTHHFPYHHCLTRLEVGRGRLTLISSFHMEMRNHKQDTGQVCKHAQEGWTGTINKFTGRSDP